MLIIIFSKYQFGHNTKYAKVNYKVGQQHLFDIYCHISSLQNLNIYFKQKNIRYCVILFSFGGI